MVRKSKTPTLPPLDRDKLEAAFNDGLEPLYPIFSDEFIETVENRACDHRHLEEWILPDLGKIGTEWQSGNAEGALLAALTIIGKMARQNLMLAAALIADKEALSSAVTQKELKRRVGKQANGAMRRLGANRRARACRLAFAEYTPTDLKRLGRKNVRKAVGELAATRLELPQAIPGETVRGYLKPRKTGGG